MNSGRFRLNAWALALAGALALSACGGSDDTVASSPVPTAPTPTTPTPLVPLAAPVLSFVSPQESLDLSNYTLTGKYSLPVGSGANLLAAEVSAVTYNPDTDTLFIVGDNGTSISQISKTGQLIDTMTLPADASKPQGTYFYDPESIAYLGGGQFVIVEERFRQANLLTYKGGTTLDVSTVKTVKLGTTVGNIGIEGVTLDPLTGGYLAVKEKTPMGNFQTGINFAAGTASNGSATTENSANLFDPALAGVVDFGDISALSNRLASTAPDYSHLVVLSQESGRILKMDRAGKIYGTLDIELAAQHEGITFDKDLNMYVTNELGTGGTSGEELWVYKPTRSAAAVGRGSNLFLTFSASVTAGSGNLILSNGAGDARTIAVTDTQQVSISGKTVVINPATDLAPGGNYSIQYAAGAFKDAAGTGVAAVNTAQALAFTTVSDITAPTLVTTLPADNAISVTGSRVALTFNEAVKAGAGTFTLSNGSDDVRVINAGDTTQVTISGGTVDINPSADLRPGTAYHLLVSATAVTDTAGNGYVGFGDTARLNFSTVASAVPSTLVAGDVLFVSANADAPDSFAFILMRDINAGTQIHFSDRDSLGATNESAFQWVADKAYAAGTIVTIQTEPSPPTANKGGTFGAGGGISPNTETIFAFQGSITGLNNTSPGALNVDRYLAAINLGTAGPLDGTLQAALNGASAFIALSPDDNVKYNGTLSTASLPALRASIANPANWSRNDTTPFPTTAGGLFP
ncbi:MAG: hypothetical protein JWR60_3619 [Polaromonas sp.]|nr:hypothetical protein [Polaromonas sp.]